MARRTTFRSVAILGTGLIGTSIGLALKQHAPAPPVIGWDRKLETARTARRRGALDQVASSLRAAVTASDCIVLATPLQSIIKMLPTVLRYAKTGSFIIDVAGLKAPVLAAAAKALRNRPDLLFAGGHPLAGSEHSGPKHARAGLFRGQPFIVCLPSQKRRAAADRKKAKQFISMLGARAVAMDARAHDRIVAATSALPQLVAACTALAVRELKPEANLVGPGYRGVTRIALSPFAPWEGPLALNARNVRRALAVFEIRVRKARVALEKGDTRALRRLFTAAASARRATTSG